MKLTDALIRNAKSGEKVIKLSDGGGLQLRLEINGSKRWILAYRRDRVQKEVSFGIYPTVSLRDARAKRDEAKVAMRQGLDPKDLFRSRLRGTGDEGPTFANVAEEVIAKNIRSGLADVTINRKRWIIEHQIPAFAKRPVSEIEAPHILDLVQTIERRGTIETAHRVRMLVSEVMRMAVVKGLAKYDPTPALKGVVVARKIKNQARITDPKRFGELLRAIDQYTGHWQVKVGLKLLALLAVRPGELRLAQWEEFDLDKAIWTIPEERAKMRKEHRVPLPQQAIDLLKDAKTLTGGKGLVLPGVTISRRPLSENTFNQALRRCGFSSEEHCSHGFRGTFSTLVNESGQWSFDVIEAQLAHQDRDSVRRAYNHARYWEERVRLAQWWADQCDEMQSSPKDEIVSARYQTETHDATWQETKSR